jgi:ATP-dependent Clp protease ATP-binding subunit ClpA
MFDRFSDGARRTISLAREESRRLGHTQIGTEHLLLGILAEGQTFAARALMSSGATLDGSRTKVAEAGSAKSPAPSWGSEAATDDLPFTDRARRALERASRLSLRRRSEQVSVEHVLLSVLDVEGTAGQVLRGLGVDMVGLRDVIDTAVEAEPSRAERGAAGQGAVLGVAVRGAAERGAERGVEEPVGPAIGAIGPAMPRCAGCGRSLDTVLAHRVMVSRTASEDSQEFIVAYCSACGRAIAAAKT